MSRSIVLSLALLSSVLAGHAPQAGAPVRDVDGVTRELFAPSDPVNVLLFVASDCPVSNGYAPEIQRLCAAYRKKGVSCTLVYEDAVIDSAAVRRHRETFGYRDVFAVIDANHTIAAAAKATVTPQAVVIAAGGSVRYRGRIDNRHEQLGRPRRVVTVHDLRDALEDLLAGRPVTTPATNAVGCYIPAAHARSTPR